MRLSILASLTLLAAAGAIATPLSKEAALRIMHQRHEGMEAVGKANKILRREVTAGSPDLAAVRGAAGSIAKLSGQSAKWFPKGTGPEVGKTGAKPEIWQKHADFLARMRDFQNAAKALNAAAAKGDISAVKARYGDLGKTCKACHDTYRSDMHH
jgi:cytochrome c556